MIIPSKEKYSQWYQDRIDRTHQAAKNRDRISGRDILKENLSTKLLYDLGYELDSATDTMVRKRNG